MLLVLRQDVSWLVAIAAFGVAGLGMGLAYSPLALIVLREASPETQGTATSALSLTDSLGTALGTGLTGALVAASLRMTDNAAAGLAAGFAAVHPDRARRPCPDRTAAAADRPGCLARDGPGPAAVVGGRGACGRLRALTRLRSMPRPRPGGPRYRVCRGAAREDPRGPRLPEARDPVLRHHDPAQGRRGVQGGDRPHARPVQGRGDRHRGRDGIARLHLQRADGLPAGRRVSSPSASWASCRPRRSPSNMRSNTARTRSRSTATRSRRVRRS